MMHIRMLVYMCIHIRWWMNTIWSWNIFSPPFWAQKNHFCKKKRHDSYGWRCSLLWTVQYLHMNSRIKHVHTWKSGNKQPLLCRTISAVKKKKFCCSEKNVCYAKNFLLAEKFLYAENFLYVENFLYAENSFMQKNFFDAEK